MVKSEAQAERRLEQSRSATPTPSRRRKRTARAASENAAHDERARSADRADEGARSNGAHVGRGGHDIGFLELLRVFGQDKI